MYFFVMPISWLDVTDGGKHIALMAEKETEALINPKSIPPCIESRGFPSLVPDCRRSLESIQSFKSFPVCQSVLALEVHGATASSNARSIAEGVFFLITLQLLIISTDKPTLNSALCNYIAKNHLSGFNYLPSISRIVFAAFSCARTICCGLSFLAALFLKPTTAVSVGLFAAAIENHTYAIS